MRSFIEHIEWFFIAYYFALHGIYFVLTAVAARHLSSFVRTHRPKRLPPLLSGCEPPVSVVVPAYNEEANIEKTLLSVLNQSYPAVQLVIVNDGSTDGTFAFLKERLALEKSDWPPVDELPSEPVKTVYASTRHENVLVVDKENGGKADALNAGISYARHPFTCHLDGDSVLEPDSLQRAVEPFFEDPTTIAVGGTLAVLNGSEVGEDGFVKRVGLARNYWALAQTLEYIRAFLFGRLGWAPFNALPIISGGFGVFRRETLIAAGGLRRDTFGEDLEITLRLHRYAREQRGVYHIGFVPGICCWTEVPETLQSFQSQRIAWHKVIAKALSMDRRLWRSGGVIGAFTYPFLLFFEALTPLVEVGGYAAVVIAWALGFLNYQSVLALGVMVLGIGMLLSTCSLVMEARAFRRFPKFRHQLVLYLFTLLENIGLRQMQAFWKLAGLLKWLFRPGSSLRPDLALLQKRELDEKNGNGRSSAAPP